MSDIVNSLKALAFSLHRRTDERAAEVCDAAVAEIERLQAELHVWRQMGRSLHEAGLRVVDVPKTKLSGCEAVRLDAVLGTAER